jgi:hypothetical protein
MSKQDWVVIRVSKETYDVLKRLADEADVSIGEIVARLAEKHGHRRSTEPSEIDEASRFDQQTDEFKAGYALAMKAVRGRYGNLSPVTSWNFTDLNTRTLAEAIDEVAVSLDIDLDSASLIN